LLRRLLPDKNKIRLNSKEEKMKYTVDKSVFELNPDIKFGIIVGENIINSETVPKEETTSSGGSSGSYRVAVSAISVEGVAKVGETLTATITPSGATASYQWMRSDSEDKDGTYTNISGATEKTYKLVAADVGK
jgi:hypothetical protein